MKKDSRIVGRMKVAYLIGGGLIIVFGAVGVLAWDQSKMEYASIPEARLGNFCAVKGDVHHKTRHFDASKKVNVFTLSDKGERLQIEYHRPLPANFDQVKQVVVKGKFHEGVFEAYDVLTK